MAKKNVARLWALLTVTIVQSDVNMFRTPSFTVANDYFLKLFTLHPWLAFVLSEDKNLLVS